ncbi:MAG TPA: cation:proton antiporter [Gemmatimonadales bacterium]|nr:cation:proton antiporter [Gemmatimonadales bacterium]
MRTAAILAVLLVVGAPPLAAAAAGDGVAPVVLALAVILAAAKLGGDLATRIGQPAVLGELVMGVVLGNLALAGIPWFEAFRANETIAILAELGVLILLFEVGLEATVRDMLKVGLPSLLVAVLGVVTPFALGWGAGILMLPDESEYVHAFLGATLCATSVGITARVLQDLGKSQSREARVILGAAVIDDVLGLIILAVVAGVITAADRGGSISLGETGLILGKATVFLVGALALGVVLSPRLFRLASGLRGRGVLLATALVFCFVLAYLSSVVGLAPIVGAYAAGLILEDVHYREFRERGEHSLEELIQPVASVLVPVFFVLMGMRVELTAFAQPGVLGFAALLTLAAILGKQACSLGAIGGGLDRLSIGIGMIPRGEVGLIFASIGMSLTIGGEPVVSQAIYSAVVIMVIVTTMATPPALKWSLARGERRRASPEAR